MHFNKIKRRHFLQGTFKGIGSMMALPFLPSLTPKAYAAPNDRKCFITIAEHHGGYNVEQLYPARNPVGEEVLYSGAASSGLDHRTRKEALSNFVAGSDGEFSPILGSFLNPYLSKINVIRGLDIMFYIGHHYGGYLGNYGSRAEPGVPAAMTEIETIDQIMARSPNFYATAPAIPVMNIHSGTGFSFAQVSGSVQQVNNQENWALLNSVVGSSNPVATADEMTRYLNAIHSDYSNLVNGAYGASRRLSSGDRQRMEEHMTLVTELRAKLETQGGISGMCAAELTGVDDEGAYYWPPELTQTQRMSKWENTIDLIIGAIKCGATRIVNIPMGIHPTFAGDWHQSIAHRQNGEADPEVLRLTMENYRFTAQHVFTQLIEKLNVDRGDGGTYIDNSLINWVQESGPITHDPVEMFAITAGSAGGYFETGNYIDFRNLSNLGVAQSEGRGITRRPGIPYNRWLYTMLKAMDIQDNEFARPGMLGYGDPYVDRQRSWFANFNNHTAWPDRVVNDMGRVLPRIVL